MFSKDQRDNDNSLMPPTQSLSLICLVRTTLTLLLICWSFSTGDGHEFSWPPTLKNSSPENLWKLKSSRLLANLPEVRFQPQQFFTHENYDRFNDDMWDFQHSRCNLPTKITREKIAEKELVVRMIYRSRNCGFRFIWKNLPRHWNILNRQDVLDVWFTCFSFYFPRTFGKFDHNSPSQISEKSAILGEVLFNQTIFWMVSHQMNLHKNPRDFSKQMQRYSWSPWGLLTFTNETKEKSWNFATEMKKRCVFLLVISPLCNFNDSLIDVTMSFKCWWTCIGNFGWESATFNHQVVWIHGKTSPGINPNQHCLLWRFVI